MKPILAISVSSLAALRMFAGEGAATEESASGQEERLFQRFVKEMQQKMDVLREQYPTNADLSSLTNIDEQSLRVVFHSAIVDPSFGLEWDEVPAPTLVGSNAMSAVNAFVSTNGWNMQTNDCIFDCLSDDTEAKTMAISGLPWIAIHEKEFPAATHNEILYVFFRGFHHNGHGVAYNPHTNRFATSIDSFKPIGQHWYVWIYDHEFPPSLPQPKIYEGSNRLTGATPVSK